MPMPMLKWFEVCKNIREIGIALYVIFILATTEYYKKFESQHYTMLTNNTTKYISQLKTKR